MSKEVKYRLSLSAVAYVVANPLHYLSRRNTLSVTPDVCGLYSFYTDTLVALLNYIFILFTEESLYQACEYSQNSL